MDKVRLSFFAVLCIGGCSEPAEETEVPSTRETKTRAATELFIEKAEDVGLSFSHRSGATGDYFFPEIMGSGGALLDFDRDGDLDVYFVQSGNLEVTDHTQPGNRLFRNELVPEGRLHFTDVTSEAGVGDTGYGMGAAVGDYNADGYPDLYVTNVGANVFFKNLGGGIFADVTAETGTGDQEWGTSAAFVDFDVDGDDDLFVANYVRYSVAGNVRCRTHSGTPDYCAPATYQPAPDVLYRNEGEVFSVANDSSGIDRAYGNGLGVVTADFNNDDLVDVYVANDQTPNNLWINRGAGRFDDEGLMSGTAFNGMGAVEASMGVTVGDVDGDGDEDLFMTHLRGETNTYYANDGDGFFSDTTSRMGLAASSLPATGFGAMFFDLENDNDLDLYIANGAVTPDAAKASKDLNPFAQANQLFIFEDGRYIDVSVEAGSALTLEHVGRGAMFGDLDNDGDSDIVVTNNNEPARLMLNDVGDRNPWLGVHLVDTTGKTSTGKVTLLTGDGEATIWRRAGRDGSYLVANDPRVLLALARDDEPADVGVWWPNGQRERFDQLGARKYHELAQSTGKPWP